MVKSPNRLHLWLLVALFLMFAGIGPFIFEAIKDLVIVGEE